ncbi:MAG: putative Mg2+ transporter-C (MgtC) family protein [bacterium P3]|nr:MAG: putative Mg2+ transporter-C (MgtC) family protein [bacterium P3]KWW42120.1 MAG: putative Mg2+ transporter-C (MgtC) family protein [bacterium F083]
MSLAVFSVRLLLALLCGILIGLERQLRQRSAGLTTNSLVAVGACIFILISETVIANAVAAGGLVNNDNLRVLAQIVTGIGFLGAGVILRDGFTIHGLNSAATLWCSAAMGSMCGYGLWREAIVAVCVILFINWILKIVEHAIENHSKDDPFADPYEKKKDRGGHDAPNLE